VQTVTEHWKKAKADLEAAEKYLDQYDSLISLLQNRGVTLHYTDFSNGTPTYAITGNKETLNELFRCLRRVGYKLSEYAQKPQEKQTYWTAFWDHENGSRIFTSFSSTACRQVKVGEKQITVDVYETVCDDGNVSVPEAV
jgi:hypothetical protein